MARQIPTQSALPLDLIRELLDRDSPVSPQTLAQLAPSLLTDLQTQATQLHDEALQRARTLIAVALETVDQPLTADTQRRLLEQADDHLAAAEHHAQIASNAGFLIEHPETMAALQAQ